MSIRIHICWAPFQQLLKVGLMYSSLRLHHREKPIPPKIVLVYRVGVVVPEKSGIQRNSQSALTQHYEAAKCRNDVGVEVN
jgi:xanthosine utilization system XapX-like protein